LARGFPGGPGLFVRWLLRARRWARRALTPPFADGVDAYPEQPGVDTRRRRFTAAARCSARRLARPFLGRRGPRLIERVTARKRVFVARWTARIHVPALGLCAGSSVIPRKNGAENPEH
jgi:hypothetical protein